MTLYENTAWVGDTFGMEAGPALDDPGQVIGDRRVRTESTTELRVLAPERRADDLPGAGLVKALPGWERLGDSGEAVTGTNRSCLDGWRLDDHEPVCLLGAFAAFDGDGGELWRPGLFVQIASLVTSGVAAVVLLVLIRRAPRSRAGIEEGPQDGMGAFENNL
jgi:hypothetical protein